MFSATAGAAPLKWLALTSCLCAGQDAWKLTFAWIIHLNVSSLLGLIVFSLLFPNDSPSPAPLTVINNKRSQTLATLAAACVKMTLKIVMKLVFLIPEELSFYFLLVLWQLAPDKLDFPTISIILFDKPVSLFISSYLIVSSLKGCLSKPFYKSSVWEQGGQHTSVKQSERSFHSVSQAFGMILLN